jgi:hypothetical protein
VKLQEIFHFFLRFCARSRRFDVWCMVYSIGNKGLQPLAVCLVWASCVDKGLQPLVGRGWFGVEQLTPSPPPNDKVSVKRWKDRFDCE